MNNNERQTLTVEFEQLTLIWLDGFISGGATIVTNCTNASPEEADSIPRRLGNSMAADPAAMETIRDSIRERLNGIEDKETSLLVNLLSDRPSDEKPI
ncbi:hypothetical protein [Mycobacteroides abscessus]|uniref:hypothetical protein n=1 Tax=Mycobacteroides abscessus TaxID=36809 RepID=UPI00092864E8|nr:hypothetical protein [Mycobacteroides abscessus]SKS05327.1 Uncharacterised protein [Mycobacteroides abscessus subsp. abscessus]SHU54684.1 Uncharacterised protein [Mycobacteroides abscessus subsp. bolletii]SHW63288.1 Uncharacterised protein [Mycobacteroides abscessus subsp. bolletii]SHW91347.1 Uncharacterised protein [Mycobacteroides abscessus subsp. bolletii]SHX33848.1 Uncharacterised protein [Mycobacteroides abscessus subsp. bolletii]